jgi:hypothetical protein
MLLYAINKSLARFSSEAAGSICSPDLHRLNVPARMPFGSFG